MQDLETEEIKTYPCVSYVGVVPIPDMEAFLVVEEEGCYLVGADGEAAGRLQWEQVEEGLYAQIGFESAQVVTEDGRILVALELMSGDRDKRIVVLDYYSLEEIVDLAGKALGASSYWNWQEAREKMF